MNEPGSEHAGVIGGGTMGRGIAEVLAASGFTVILLDRERDLAGSMAASVNEALAARPTGGQGVVVGEAFDAAALRECRVVVEAVPEVAALKGSILADASRALREGALLASNTSSLSIDDLAGHVREPGAFLGMHFFNPVPRSQLVEIVRGERTSSASLASAHELARRLGLESIEVCDSPGFATSRLGVALGLEAIRMAEDGVASPSDIDRAMILGYRHPIGPLRLTDLIGLDVRLDIARHLEKELGPRFSPPALLARMVERGHLGRKSGRGFYEWAGTSTASEPAT